MYYKRSKLNVKDQSYSVKTPSDNQIIALFWEIWVAKSNGDVRILIGSYEIAVCAHAQYEIGSKQPRTIGTTSGGLKLQCIRNCHIF